MSTVPSRPLARVVALAGLIAAHFAAAACAVQGAAGLIGLQELRIVVPLVTGLVCGQAILLGQFLVLAAGWPLFRVPLAAGWYVLMIALAQPLLRLVGRGSSDAAISFSLCLAMPMVFSVLAAAGRRASGVRLALDDSPAEQGEEPVQFSLRHLLVLTLLSGVVLAGVRLAREAFDDSSQFLLFGFLPGTAVFLVLPYLSLWATLGRRRPLLRSAALVALALAGGVAPPFIARAKVEIYWTFGCLTVVPFVVVVGTLLLVRLTGHRLVVDRRATFRAAEVV